MFRVLIESQTYFADPTVQPPDPGTDPSVFESNLRATET